MVCALMVVCLFEANSVHNGSHTHERSEDRNTNRNQL